MASSQAAERLDSRLEPSEQQEQLVAGEVGSTACSPSLSARPCAHLDQRDQRRHRQTDARHCVRVLQGAGQQGNYREALPTQAAALGMRARRALVMSLTHSAQAAAAVVCAEQARVVEGSGVIADILQLDTDDDADCDRQGHLRTKRGEGLEGWRVGETDRCGMWRSTAGTGTQGSSYGGAKATARVGAVGQLAQAAERRRRQVPLKVGTKAAARFPRPLDTTCLQQTQHMEQDIARRAGAHFFAASRAPLLAAGYRSAEEVGEVIRHSAQCDGYVGRAGCLPLSSAASCPPAAAACRMRHGEARVPLRLLAAAAPSSILQPGDGAMSTGAGPPQGGASPPLQGSPGGVITVVNSTARQVDAVEQQLQALASALTHGGGAQAATLRHLELFEAAVQGLKVGGGAQVRACEQAVCTRLGAAPAWPPTLY